MSDPALDRLLDTIAVRAPGLVEGAARLELGSALREFCQETRAWQEDQTLTVGANTSNVVLPTPPVEAYPAWVLRMRVQGGQPLQSATLPMREIPGGQPTYFFCPSPGVVTLSPATDKTYIFELTVSMVPTAAEANVLPSGFYDLHFEALLSGALFRLYATPGRPYSNSTLAEYHGKRFRAEMARTRAIVRAGLTFGTPVAGFPYPAGRRQRGML